MAATTTAVSKIEDQFEFLGWGFETVTRAPVPLFCDEGSFLETSGGWGRCCDSEPCAFATECTDDTLIFDNNSRQTCISSCLTISILSASPAEDDAQTTTRIACFTDWSVDTEIYRAFPAATTTGEDGSVITVPPKSTTDGDETITTSEITSTTSGGGGGAIEGGNSYGSSDSTSQAWIAGAVIGPVALITISLLIFWFLRKRLRKREAAAAPVEAPTNHPNGNGNFPSATSEAYKYGGPPLNPPGQMYSQGSMPGMAPALGSGGASSSEYAANPAQGPPPELPGDMAYQELPGDTARR